MDASRRKQINELALTIRESLELTTPINVDEVVNRLGGVIEEFDPYYGKDAEAYVRKDTDSFAIAVDETVGYTRRRFSIAHELGHLFLHLGYLIDDELWGSVDSYIDSVRHRMGYNEEEFEAHEFAGALLMPADEFNFVADKLFFNGLYPLDKIANHFNVSSRAVKVRGCWLGIFSWE